LTSYLDPKGNKLKYIFWFFIILSPRFAQVVYALVKNEELLNGLPESYP